MQVDAEAELRGRAVNRSQAASDKNKMLEDQMRNLVLAKETAHVSQCTHLSFSVAQCMLATLSSGTLLMLRMHNCQSQAEMEEAKRRMRAEQELRLVHWAA